MKVPSGFAWYLKTCDTQVFAFEGMNQPASLNVIVPFGCSVKSITCVPCEYQPMKIRFWPGICWNTCAVQNEACAPVRIGAR